jgi:hypothetical protein
VTAARLPQNVDGVGAILSEIKCKLGLFLQKILTVFLKGVHTGEAESIVLT